MYTCDFTKKLTCIQNTFLSSELQCLKVYFRCATVYFFTDECKYEIRRVSTNIKIPWKWNTSLRLINQRQIDVSISLL